MASAIIDTASSGDTTIVTAPAAGRAIRVQGYVLFSGGNDTVSFNYGTDSIKLTGSYPFAAQSGVVAPWNSDGWFDLPQATPLVLNKGGAVQTSGHVRYGIIG